MEQKLIAETFSLVDLYIIIAKRRRGRDDKIQELLDTKNIEQKAVLAIVRVFEIAREIYDFKSQYPYVLQDVIKLIEHYEVIKNGIRAWRNDDRQNILFLVMPVYDENFEDVKRLTEVLGADLMEEQDVYGNIALTKMSWRYLNEAMKTCFNDKKYFALMKQWWIKSMPEYNEIENGLFDYFEWSEEDRLKLENKVNSSNGGYFEPRESRLWLLLAKKFPRNGDEVLKLKVLLQRSYERSSVRLLLAHHSKEIDIRALIPKQMNNWPLTFSAEIGNYFISMFRRVPVLEVDDELRETVSRFHPDLQRYLITRATSPSWILEVFAKQRIPNTIDFFSLADQQYQNGTIDKISTFNFEELPSDIIFCVARLLSYKQLIRLSLTNKRMRSIIANNEYLINQLCRRYLTGIIVPATEFRQKFRSRDRKSRLLTVSSKPRKISTKSVELTKEDILLTFTNGYITVDWYKIDGTRRKPISYFGSMSMPTWTDVNLSARVHKQNIAYVVHGQNITVVSGGSGTRLTGTRLINSDLINGRYGYFQLTENELIGLGYCMDLTTNQIQSCPWTADLLTIQMSNDNAHTGYGIDSSCHVIKQFDVRAPSVTSSQSAVSVHDGVVQNFAVRDDGHTMFVAARHVSEWDTRALRAPVKISSDLNLTYSEQYGHSRPAIDLTSMKMVGREQLWDLADFTWKFNRNLHNANKIASNGQICIYEQPEVLPIHRTGCDSYSATDFYCGG